jgi:thiamine-phosphate pyrophosphorylase
VRLPDPPILLISDRKRAKAPLVQELAEAVAGGCRWIMLREKDLDEGELAKLVGEVRRRIEGRGVCLTVNSAVDLVPRCQLAGVHLPADGCVGAARRELGAGVLIGQSAHNQAAIETAEREGADYATISPVFPSISKDDGRQALGIAGLTAAANASALPLIALGGVSQGEAAACRRAGAAGIAVLGAVIGQASPGAAMAEVLAAWRDGE